MFSFSIFQSGRLASNSTMLVSSCLPSRNSSHLVIHEDKGGGGLFFLVPFILDQYSEIWLSHSSPLLWELNSSRLDLIEPFRVG